MKVCLMSELVIETGLIPPQILPDHSLLMGRFKTSIFDNSEAPCNPPTHHSMSHAQPQNAGKPPKKNIKKMKENFFITPVVHVQVLATINKIENSIKNQTDIDQLWSEVRQIFINELNQLPDIPSSISKKPTKQFRKCKDFWNQELSSYWELLSQKEKEYLNFKVLTYLDNAHKRVLLFNYREAQKSFNSKFRYFKRKHKKQQLFDLERDTRNNPQKMWERLKKLGDPPSSKAVLEIIREDESISTDIQEILTRWHTDISKLFSGLRDNPEFSFDDQFFEEILAKKEELENSLPQEFSENSQYDTNELNTEILFAEVSKCIDKAKLKKAYLEIPNEALKNENAKLLLFKFFKLCFECGINPTEWDKNNIKPIPKKDKEPRDPLQNRCITIMCCVAKIYSSILTNSLQKFLEKNNILVDE